MTMRAWTPMVALGLIALMSGCGGGADPDACKPESCSGRGVCTEVGDDISCACFDGYAGESCEECAPGYADPDGDGVCEAQAACEADSCSGHGVCDDSSGAPVCTCDAGYAGDACATCADGYHLEADACVADAVCTADSCGGHGTCDDSSGQVVCTCDVGYEGQACDACAAGYHDDGQGGCVADETCQANTCSGHGACDDSGGAPVCTCDAGYAGLNCSQCAEGYQDNDADDTCLEGCDLAALDCSGHGQCSDLSGIAVCECDEGYTGLDCAGCEAGYQDNDADGTCEPGCALVDLDCSGHGQCSDTSGSARCLCDDGWTGLACDACAAGYHPDGQGGCAADTDCQVNSCNGHGQCDDATGVVVCDCDDNYEGDHCELCAAGYQDNDADGTCLPDCATAGLDCGAHGQCSDSDGAAACVCDAGYAGQGCDQCAAGYQDNDGDGTCQPDCATAGLTCSDHGQCSDAGGQAACICDAGYAGADCSACAAQYQDNDGDGTCLPSCAGAPPDCSGHGTCSDASGQVACVCNPGYQGSDCSDCADDYQDNDGDGTCLPDCSLANLDCSGHGQCSDTSGQAACLCDTGYAGADCAACAAQYQDNDGDGTCAPACAIAGLDCGTHGHCDDGSGAAECTCDEGYTGADCTTCAAGYQDNDGNGTCRPDCSLANLTCNGHGTCDDSDGTAGCLCDLEYTGVDCQYCAVGYQNNDGDGLCLPDCATAGLDCGAHGHCDDHGGQATCACDVGYTGQACAACAAGYQDNDGDGDCLPDCGLLGWACSGHGQCDDTGGVAICLCDAGYTDDGAGNCIADGQGETCADPIHLDLVDGTVTGDTTGMGDDETGSCNTNAADDVIYTFDVVENIHATFDLSGSDYDTLMYLRSTCDDPASELACDDDGGDGLDSLIDIDLTPGTYYLIIDGYSSNAGQYLLTISLSCGPGQVYDPDSDTCVDDPCDPNPCGVAGQTICEVDLPGYVCQCDPGWIPDGAGGCIPDPNPHGEACGDALTLPIAEGSVLGSTLDAADDAQGGCVGDGPDRVYGFTLAAPMRAEFLMEGYDTGLHLRTVCDDPASEVACDDDGGAGTNAQLIEFLDAGSYFLWADSYSGGGDYELFYSFRADPCDPDPCPGTPECVAEADWSAYTCVCPAGTLPWGNDCVDDPCEPNPCDQPNMNRCVPDLPSSYTCECNVGYIPDGAGGCMLDPDANEWAFIVFLNADNNLESFGYDDVAEMGQAGSTPFVHIVALFDTYAGPADVIYVTQGGYDVIDNWGEVDMSDWQQLRDFGIWAVQNYPARHYAFIMWDHGGGWKGDVKPEPFKGFSNDDHGTEYEISISNGDFAAAMAGITAALGDKLDVVGFDACLMGMWEVASAAAPYAHYLVASSETEPGIGWPYHGFLPGLVNDYEMSPEELAISIVDAYYSESTSDSTLAATNLDTMGDLDAAMTAFANALMANPGLYSDFESARQASESFTYADFRDLQDFAERVAAIAGAPASLVTAANNLIAQLQTTIVYSRAQSSYPGSNGLSIYFPALGSSVDSDYRGAGAVWSNNTTWDEFLYDFAN